MWPPVQQLRLKLRRGHRGVLSFDQSMRESGGPAGAIDRGIVVVPTRQIVGSVSRHQNLRSDFFYRTGEAMTQRFRRIGEAMQAGRVLPPVVLYKLQRHDPSGRSEERTEYYVVDGHHRVAMARKLGQEYLDAYVTEYISRDTQLAHMLRRTQLLRDAPAEDLAELWKRLSERQVRPDEIICRRGEPGDNFYMIRSGTVEVRLGVGPRGIALYQLYAGASFGEMALLTDEPRSADVVAIEQTSLWVLARSDFDALLNRSVPLLKALNRTLAERIMMTTAVVEQVQLATDSNETRGVRYGQYRVVAQVGAGGMSVVYSAVRESDGMAVALKVLPTSWGAARELRERLRREAAILQELCHPGVVRVLEVGSVSDSLGGGTFIAMEWLPDALDRVLSAQYPQPLEWRLAVRIAIEIAHALSVVHAAGLIHRDVKPSNILLRADGSAVLSDFGLAAALVDLAAERRLTPPNVLLGTADYLAPEAIAGSAVDGRADLYSLGVVLYQMVSGVVPFAGREPASTLRAHLEEVPPALPTHVPEPVRAAVARALAKRPEERFPSASAMAESLREVALPTT